MKKARRVKEQVIELKEEKEGGKGFFFSSDGEAFFFNQKNKNN